jgi:hypothetical protein
VGDPLPGPLLVSSPGLDQLDHPHRGRVRAAVRH